MVQAGRQLPVFAARLRGVDVGCLVEVNEEEHWRRRARGLGAIGDRSVINALAGLPAHAEVLRASLPSAVERALRREAAAGTVDGGQGVVRRRAVPPLRVALVVVQDTVGPRGLARASRFGPYAQRLLIMPGLPADPTELLLEAAYLGVGVATPEQPDVVAPAPFTPTRFTSASWAFAEQAYAQWLDHRSRTRGNATMVPTAPARV